MTKKEPSYTVPLRDHLEKVIDLRIDPLVDRMDRDQEYVKDALLISNNNLERRLGDIAISDFVRKGEMKDFEGKMEKEIRPLHDFQIELRAKADQKTVIISLIIAVIGALIGTVSIIVNLIK